jgi:hypothetical protein
MDVHLSPTEFRKVTWTDHENANRPLQRLVPSIAGRFAGSYITYHDPSAFRPSALASRVLGRPGISRSNLRVNGFEALNNRRCCEPLDAFPRTSSKADA